MILSLQVFSAIRVYLARRERQLLRANAARFSLSRSRCICYLDCNGLPEQTLGASALRLATNTVRHGLIGTCNMCGIAGLIATGRDASSLAATAGRMADALSYRGPDGSGIWSDDGVALAHRRLAIVDLTPTGAQPMISVDGRWAISYNGEVYSADKIFQAMPGLKRRGTSDTEIILESIARRGLERTVADLNGMFAIALWDRTTRTLHLLRDRLGIKPLFFGRVPGGVAFASELKAFAAAGFSFHIDEASVASFLRFGYVPSPHSIWRDVSKLRPGEIVSIGPSGEVQRKLYWSLPAVAAEGLAKPFHGSDSEAEETLHALVADAVSINMTSDVPLGAFLSGGVDSSLVVALMVAANRRMVRTFSIGFPEFGFDETAYSKQIARHLGTEHHELIVTAADALSVVPHLAEIYDEPFADSSQIPTFAISKMTRQHVTVALSGDGGDELFAGYNRYLLGSGNLAWISSIPRLVRRGAAAVLRNVPDEAAAQFARALPSSLRPAMPVDKLHKLAKVLALEGDAIYMRLVSQNENPAALTRGLREHLVTYPTLPQLGTIARMQLFDSCTYLPDDILQKVDRASMAVSLEVRPPLLDHRLLEFVWTLPRHMLIRRRETKWLLRRVLDRYVPRALIDRPKMGFAIPLADWLRGPLREWADGLISSHELGGGLLDTGAVRRGWQEHASGTRNWAAGLWTILMFETWRKRWNNRSSNSGYDAISRS